jgi:hypothetical protein
VVCIEHSIVVVCIEHSIVVVSVVEIIVSSQFNIATCLFTLTLYTSRQAIVIAVLLNCHYSLLVSCNI